MLSLGDLVQLGWMLLHLFIPLHLMIILISAILINITTVDNSAPSIILAPFSNMWNGPLGCNGCLTPQITGSTYAAAIWNNSKSIVSQNSTLTFTGE